MHHRPVTALIAAPELQPAPWSLERASRGARRFALTFSLYVAMPAIWYVGIATDIGRGLWNWVVLDALLVIPGVVRGLVVLLG